MQGNGCLCECVGGVVVVVVVAVVVEKENIIMYS